MKFLVFCKPYKVIIHIMYQKNKNYFNFHLHLCILEQKRDVFLNSKMLIFIIFNNITHLPTSFDFSSLGFLPAWLLRDS